MAAQETTKQPLKVLLVEDTKTVTALIQVYLMSWGMEFAIANDGAEGLVLAKKVNPQLIISDVSMPKMDGFELCAAIRSDPVLHSVPIILLTGLKDESSRQKGRLVGATTFLSKPIRPDQLQQTVASVLHLEPKS